MSGNIAHGATFCIRQARKSRSCKGGFIMAYRPAMEKTSETLRYSVATKNILTPDDAELYELANYAGIVTDPKVFKIIVDLLRLNVAPTAIDRMLKSMTVQRRKPHLQDTSDLSSSSSSTTMTSLKSRSSGLRKPSQR